jgi:hypothetical protein
LCTSVYDDILLLITFFLINYNGLVFNIFYFEFFNKTFAFYQIYFPDFKKSFCNKKRKPLTLTKNKRGANRILGVLL